MVNAPEDVQVYRCIFAARASVIVGMWLCILHPKSPEHTGELLICSTALLTSKSFQSLWRWR